MQKSQRGHQVAYRTSFEHIDAGDSNRDGAGAEFFGELLPVSVLTEQNCEVAPAEAVAFAQLANLFGNFRGFGFVISRQNDFDRRSLQRNRVDF